LHVIGEYPEAFSLEITPDALADVSANIELV